MISVKILVPIISVLLMMPGFLAYMFFVRRYKHNSVLAYLLFKIYLYLSVMTIATAIGYLIVAVDILDYIVAGVWAWIIWIYGKRVAELWDIYKVRLDFEIESTGKADVVLLKKETKK